MQLIILLSFLTLTSSVFASTDSARFEDRMETNQARAQKREDEFEDRREALQEKLQAFQDTQRAERISRVNDKLVALNERITDHFVNVLDQLSTVLSRTEERTQKRADAGDDVAAVQTAIEEANDAIATAQSAVSTQAGENYTIVLTDEQTARSAVKTMFEQLRADLKTTRATVVAAREAVHAAAVALGKINN